jgi:glycerol-3-phosphate O-acyltransferase / dihydroxyacetone phosphate acyltransferase
VILAANHNNAMVDALLVATSINREVRLTAKATLLDHPVTRLVVLATGIVPLRRRADERRTGGEGNVTRNEDAFREVVATLGSGGVILIFPEGISHSGPQLAPLRTGCARMALQARRSGVAGVQIVPVGLTFEHKESPRTSVFMQLGQPIDVDETLGSATDDGMVETLTARLDHGLRQVTLNFPTHEEALRVLDLSRTLGRLFDRLRELSEGDTPLSESVSLARRLDEIRLAMPTLSSEMIARVDAFLNRLERFARRVTALHLPLNDIWMPTSVGSGIWFVVRESLLIAITAPIALWGRINHWLPLRGALWLGRATSTNPDEPAMRTIVLGLVFVLVTYAAVAITIGAFAGWWWALLYLIALPFAASIDFRFSDRLARAVRRARGYLQFRAKPRLQGELIEEAALLRGEAESLDLVLS